MELGVFIFEQDLTYQDDHDAGIVFIARFNSSGYRQQLNKLSAMLAQQYPNGPGELEGGQGHNVVFCVRRSLAVEQPRNLAAACAACGFTTDVSAQAVQLVDPAHYNANYIGTTSIYGKDYYVLTPVDKNEDENESN
jgi:hypothetical protein